MNHPKTAADKSDEEYAQDHAQDLLNKVAKAHVSLKQEITTMNNPTTRPDGPWHKPGGMDDNGYTFPTVYTLPGGLHITVHNQSGHAWLYGTIFASPRLLMGATNEEIRTFARAMNTPALGGEPQFKPAEGYGLFTGEHGSQTVDIPGGSIVFAATKEPMRIENVDFGRTKFIPQALAATPAPQPWTPEVKARCERKCGNVGDPACYRLPELTSDAPKDIKPCAECAGAPTGAQAQTGRTPPLVTPDSPDDEVIYYLDKLRIDGKVGTLFEAVLTEAAHRLQERLAAAESPSHAQY